MEERAGANQIRLTIQVPQEARRIQVYRCRVRACRALVTEKSGNSQMIQATTMKRTSKR